MAQRHRVLVLYRQSLFTQGLQRLLEQAGDFEVVGIDLDVQDPVAALQGRSPTVVVVDADELCAAGRELFIQILRETPSVQLVCVTALDGRVEVYRRGSTRVMGSNDLFEALRTA